MPWVYIKHDLPANMEEECNEGECQLEVQLEESNDQLPVCHAVVGMVGLPDVRPSEE